MSAFTDLKDAVAAANASIDALAVRVAAIPTGTSDADIATVTADISAAKAKLDAIALPAA